MKKLISLVLAMLMFAVPCLAEPADAVIGGADAATDILLSEDLSLKALDAGRKVTSTLTFTEVVGLETGDPTVDAAIADLFKALGLKVTQQGDEFAFALQLSEQDVLDLGVAVNGEDCYIKSGLLGGTVVIGKEEVEPLVGRVLDMLVSMEAMTQEQANELKAQVSQIIATFETAMQSAAGMALTEEAFTNMDLSAIENAVAAANTKVVPIEEIVVPGMCDPAVSGEKGVYTNEDMVQIMKAWFQVLLDNPAILNYFGSLMGYPTQADVDAAWQAYGELYLANNLVASEEEFRAQFVTLEQELRQMMTQLETSKVIDGEVVIAVYYDEAGEVVYMTMDMPLYQVEQTVAETEDPAAVQGKTIPVSMTYARQTVAQGVSHVINMKSEGETFTIDALISDGQTTISINGVDETQYNVHLADLVIKTGENAENANLKTLDVEGSIFAWAEQEVKVCDVKVAGEYEFNAARSYFAGDAALTIYPDDAQAPVTIVFELGSDCAVNGVDFNSVDKVSFEVMGIKIGMQVVTATSDPDASIMAGEVIRPAELDDAAFSNWFVRVVTSFSGWLGNVMMALPESVMALFFNTGM
ncbi:MAG: hypothetical protein IJB81_10795 [Clostridia bacterium]|nr:hypothetical protein [Clostridia bacterium]